MHALNHQLQQNIIDADGSYLLPEQISPLENYIETYQKRLETYNYIQKNSDNLVLNALKKLARIHPDIIRNSGKRCQFDMSEVLRYVALAILMDDDFMFREKMMFWLDTMLRAHDKKEVCRKAYGYLQEVVTDHSPAEHRVLINPLFDTIFESLQSY